MKLQPSLKLYVIGGILFTGIASILAMSAIGVSFFFLGMDVAMTGSIQNQAYHTDVEDGHPFHLSDLTIASRWQDLPVIIQDNFDETLLVDNEMSKTFDRLPIFTMPKQGLFVIRMSHDNDVRYASIILNEKTNFAFEKGELPHFFYIIFLAIAIIVLFASVIFFILRRVTVPVERLKNWAKSLDKEKLQQPAPSFHYSELDTLAIIIQSSLQDVQAGLDREQQFLGYASHELRTPIAVIRTNAELLRKMVEKGISTDKQIAVIDRIERSGLTMTDLTETLLWLNRNQDKVVQERQLCLGDLAQQINQEVQYLLTGKAVEVAISTDHSLHHLPEPLCRIIITNLIRNAFQHTQQGKVVIKQVERKLTITNIDQFGSGEESNLGFGLGLELTAKLVNQYGWHYHNQAIEGGRYVELSFDRNE
ncbi:histidine kinase [Vibrio sp. 10N.286.49.B3]|uniref:sensor histidine kinase n=1 Tax=Vibrio sp. 10N.286.49.B3 TaxID=1880855 RepID=UPI000C8292CB|nr:HAMP domain-containing sensor histidine kinase [Vibrio sp. 10N.286.49.B3]PMH43255.1 histidine kinase [Vibrio sp. 10N.286.49.B3]